MKLRASPHGKVAVASLATGWHWRASVELGRTQVSTSCAAPFPWGEAEQMPKGSYSGWAVVTISPTPTSSGGLTGQLGAGTGPGRSLRAAGDCLLPLVLLTFYVFTRERSFRRLRRPIE